MVSVLDLHSNCVSSFAPFICVVCCNYGIVVLVASSRTSLVVRCDGCRGTDNGIDIWIFLGIQKEEEK